MPTVHASTAVTPESRPIVIQPRESFLGKLVMGVFCSALVSVLMNFFVLKKAILFTFAAILALCGWKTEPPQDIKDQAYGLRQRVEETAGSSWPIEAVGRLQPGPPPAGTGGHAVSGRCPGCGAGLTIEGSAPISDEDHASCYRCNREFLVRELLRK